MAKTTVKAYIPSLKEYRELKSKYPAFAAKQATQKAEQNGVSFSINWNNQCSYFLRTPWTIPGKNEPTNDSITIGHITGKEGIGFPENNQTGLVIALTLIYNSSSDIVKKCKFIEKCSYVDNGANREQLWSEAPVVMFGGNEYVWLNKEECEQGKSQIMTLISVEVLEKALPISNDASHNDFTQAKTLQSQCDIVAFENATDEEMEMVVPVEMTSEDGCEKLTYNFTDKQKENLQAYVQFEM